MGRGKKGKSAASKSRKDKPAIIYESQPSIPQQPDRVPQTPADCFHRWLIEFATLIASWHNQEHRKWHEAFNNCLSPKWDDMTDYEKGEAFSNVGECNPWGELLLSLNLMKASFGNLHRHEQVNSVIVFEIESVQKMISKDKGIVSEPVSVDVLKKAFFVPFLEELFQVVWLHIMDKDLEQMAILYLKKVTVDKNEWTLPCRATETVANHVGLRPSRNLRPATCEICGGPAALPYPTCKFCNQNPCYHHGRCCPMRDSRTARASSSRVGV